MSTRPYEEPLYHIPSKDTSGSNDDHSTLLNLDYESSGHTGFAAAGANVLEVQVFT